MEKGGRKKQAFKKTTVMLFRPLGVWSWPMDQACGGHLPCLVASHVHYREWTWTSPVRGWKAARSYDYFLLQGENHVHSRV